MTVAAGGNEPPAPGPAGVDAKEREIWLRSLREYSEQCEAPELTPGCPYRQVSDSIGPFCLDECVELLASHHAPPPVETEVRVGDLTIVRSRQPRTRRNLLGPRKAFDAREEFLADAALPTEQRRTAALFYGLVSCLAAPRFADKDDDETVEVDPGAVLDALARRGYDAEMLVRDGLGSQIAMAILWSSGLTQMVNESGDEPLATHDSVAAWMPLLLDGFDSTAPPLGALVGKKLPALLSWVATAPLADVISWSAPSHLDPPTGPPKPATGGVNRWIVDRLVSTYLGDWDTESLKFEWRFQRGLITAPCDSIEMTRRNIDTQELSRHLADRATLADDDGGVSGQVRRFTPVAAKLLGAGNRAGATAIFEAIVEADPKHPEAQNNLGFCLLPDDPGRALTLLQSAADSYVGSITPANIGNRVLAFALLGRYTSALELAERFYEESKSGRTESGWMWDETILTTKDIRLLEVPCMRCFIIRLAETIASLISDEKSLAVWSERRNGHGARHSVEPS